MDNERIKTLTSSQLACFKQCRKRYEFEYVQCLRPVETPKALEIGTLYHAGLEMLLKGSNMKTVTEAIMKMQEENARIKCIDFDPMHAIVASLMVEHFNDNVKWEDWHIVGVEIPFEVITGYAKRMLGKIDGIVEDDNGDRFLLEHKTTSQYGEEYLHNLLWDEQSTNYIYAYNKMLEIGQLDGKPVKGIFYNIIEKPSIKPYLETPDDKKKYTKAGTLYAGQHDHDETPFEYGERVREWYLSELRVHQHYVYRTQEDIAEHIKDFNLAMKDIVACEREGTFYRNPNACKFMPCPFRPKCLDNVPDTDCLYIKKEFKNEELGR